MKKKKEKKAIKMKNRERGMTKLKGLGYKGKCLILETPKSEIRVERELKCFCFQINVCIKKIQNYTTLL